MFCPGKAAAMVIILALLSQVGAGCCLETYFYTNVFFVVRAEVLQLSFIGVALLYIVSFSNFNHVVISKISVGVIWVLLCHISICIFNCVFSLKLKAR